MSITWTVIDPGATGIKEEWENNQKLAEYFRTISTGDCGYWLWEFLKHWKKMQLPEPTGNRLGRGGGGSSLQRSSAFMCGYEYIR
jgi:hypothetical protein